MSDECIICKEARGGGCSPFSTASRKSLRLSNHFVKKWATISERFDVLNKVKDLQMTQSTPTTDSVISICVTKGI